MQINLSNLKYRGALARWRRLLGYSAAAVAAIGVLVMALTPSASLVVDDWARSDVQLRSKLIFNSIKDQVATYLSDSKEQQLTQLFELLTDDEKLLGLAFCETTGAIRYATKMMPATLSCERLARNETASFSEIDLAGSRLLVSMFPLSVKDRSGHIAIVHDLAFAAARSAKAQLYWLLAVVGTAGAFVVFASVLASILLKRWRGAVRTTLQEIRSGEFVDLPTSAFTVLGPELRQLVRELRQGLPQKQGSHVKWTRDSLRTVLTQELPKTHVIVVSNREPYIHNHSASGISVQIPASGLVAALEPVMRACGGTWIAHGSGTADRETVDAMDRVRVPPETGEYALRRVWLTEEEQAGYYYGFANEGLWPLCHISFVRPNFREFDWQVYREVNERFAKAVAEEAMDEAPVILVQDYHFSLLPRLIRNKLPRATIVAFWHIPWPNAETFSICPWKEEIIDGLLGADIIGFHTQFHCNNFLETVDRFMESRIDRERASVFLRGHDTAVRPYPISIEWPPLAMAGQAPIVECRRALRERFGLPLNTRIAVGVERFDYTKGVLDRLRGVDELLTRYPSWKGKFVFVQAAAPSRSQLPAYQNLQREAVELVDNINTRHTVNGIRPIELIVRHHEPAEVFELFRAADVCVVSSLHDGMNLVAKEFVAARDDNKGVLILSHFAGASRELAEALIVNPYDAHALGAAFQQALEMTPEEQHTRMSLMRTLVSDRNVYRWAGQILTDAAHLRRQEEVLKHVYARAVVS